MKSFCLFFSMIFLTMLASCSSTSESRSIASDNSEQEQVLKLTCKANLYGAKDLGYDDLLKEEETYFLEILISELNQAKTFITRTLINKELVIPVGEYENLKLRKGGNGVQVFINSLELFRECHEYPGNKDGLLEHTLDQYPAHY